MTDPSRRLPTENASTGGSSCERSSSQAAPAGSAIKSQRDTSRPHRPGLFQHVQENQMRLKSLQEAAIDLIGQREPIHEAFDCLSESFEEWRQQDPHTAGSRSGLGQAARAVDLACQLLQLIFQVLPQRPDEAPMMGVNDRVKAVVKLDHCLGELMEGNNQHELTTTLLEKMAGRLMRLRAEWGIEVGQVVPASQASTSEQFKDHEMIDQSLRYAVLGLQRELSQDYWDRGNSLKVLKILGKVLLMYDDACRQVEAAGQEKNRAVPDAQRCDGMRAFSVIAVCHAYGLLRYRMTRRFATREPFADHELMLFSTTEQVYRSRLSDADGLVDSLSELIQRFDPFPGAHGVIKVLEALQRFSTEERAVSARSDERIVLTSKPPEMKGYEDFAHAYQVLQAPLPLQSVSGDFAQIKQTLIDESPWLNPVTEQIFRQLQANLALDPEHRTALLPPMLLLGDPSSGKTYFAQRLTELLGLSTTTISLSGMADSMTFRGAPRGYSSARSSVFVQKMVELGIANPTFILDELEKVARGSQNGNPHDVLLQCLEPGNARQFFDECLQVQLDLSYCNYIATGNSLDGVPMALRSRFQIIQVNNPTRDDLRGFAIAYWARQMAKYNYQPAWMPELPESTLDAILTQFKTLRGVTRAIEALVAIDITRQNRPDSRH